MRAGIRTVTRVLGPVISGILIGFPATAHHSGATYFNLDAEVVHENVTVVAYHVVNPHGRLIYLVTDDAGNEVQWSAELPSANNMRRRGLGDDVFKAEDELTVVSGAPGRTEPNFMRLSRAEFANGDVATFTGASAGLTRAGAQ